MISKMARTEKTYSPEVMKYQEDIKVHPNYDGLEYGGSWVKAGNSEDGKKRQAWADKKITELGITGSGIYAKLMYAIHPFKVKPCQTCGQKMSLDYVYPNKHFVKKLNGKFPTLEGQDLLNISIQDILEMIDAENQQKFIDLLRSTVKKEDTEKLDLYGLVQCLIEESREGLIKALGPGAMSNFPDRFDGFHSYNRCCRAKEDTGRSAENLKSYTKDRRAYEAWSDGNHRAANQLMGDKIFSGTGLSADHLGPISLGFVHDPRFIKPMTSGENSSKRDRLILSDLVTMIEIEARENIIASSWFSDLIWQSIKNDIRDGKITSDEILKNYQTILKKNKDLFFNILGFILSHTNGQEFLLLYLEQRYKFENNYLYDYVLDTDTSSKTFGQIKSKTSRNLTARADGEEDRAKRIGLEAIEDYISKDNRKIKEVLNELENEKLEIILYMLTQKTSFSYENILLNLKKLMEIIQKRLLAYSLSI
jgi:Alw26I/Eco31I/Esp3I family type II restriction endonuclease